MTDYYIPDPRGHLRLSLIKSGLRIASGVAFIMTAFAPIDIAVIVGGIFLVLAEFLGIAEELV
jgi:hypothetical protein